MTLQELRNCGATKRRNMFTFQSTRWRPAVGANLATSWSYLSNTGDRRLAGISNVGLATSQFSNYQFTTTPENFISAIFG